MQAETSERDIRRSYALGVFNGAAFHFASRLIDPPLVLAWFVSQLTTSNVLIGLVTPLGQASWALPQVFVSNRIQQMEHKMPAYRLAAGIRVGAWLLLSAMVWLTDKPSLLLVAFFFLYGIAWVAAGLGGISFFDILAKTIPAWRRGSLFSRRQFLGGLLGLGAGWIVKVVLTHPGLSFPRGHAMLFLLYAVVIMPTMGAFLAIREPAGKACSQAVSLRDQFERGGQIVRADSVYRRYIGARLAVSMAGMALPFYGIFAKNTLNAPEAMVGIYVTVRVGAQLLCNLLWGRVSDRRGNQLILRLLCIGLSGTALLALILVVLARALHLQGDWLPYLAFPLFIFDGAILPAKVLSGANFLMELVPEAERPLYIGLSNTLIGVVVLVSGLGGVLVDLAGFELLFATAVGFGLIGYHLASQLPEPREERRSEVEPDSSA